MSRETHPNFVPNNTAGTRQETAVLLVGTAREFGIPQREIASAPTSGGFFISDALADVLYADVDEAEPEDKPEKAEPKATKKTSGNRAAKTDSQEGE